MPRYIITAGSNSTDLPCAAKGLTSYRARGRYGWIMIGATDVADAWREALRSTDTPTDLQRWDGTAHRPVRCGVQSAPTTGDPK